MNISAEKYIDVIGEASVTEKPLTYFADLTLQVIAPSSEKALGEMADLLKAVIKKLIGITGLTSDQVIDGGADVWPLAGDDHMKGSKCVVQWITIKTQEKKILSKALSEIDGLFGNGNHSYSYQVRRPEFCANSAVKAKSLNRAIEDARTKAMIIANAANINLGGVLQICEMEDGAGLPEHFADPRSENRPLSPRQDKSGQFTPVEKIRPVRYRVRFAIDTVD